MHTQAGITEAVKPKSNLTVWTARLRLQVYISRSSGTGKKLETKTSRWLTRRGHKRVVCQGFH